MKLKGSNSQALNKSPLHQLTDEIRSQERVIREGGGEKGRERQERHGRLTVRKRLELLLDDPNRFFELGLWAGYKMYEKWGGVPAAALSLVLVRLATENVW